MSNEISEINRRWLDEMRRINRCINKGILMEEERRPKIIAVDFDGTLCENKYPAIGMPNQKLISELKKGQRENGDRVILWTCRAGDCLQKAIEWCWERGLIFDVVNENLPESIEYFGGDTRKIFADEYIDDRNSKVWKNFEF